MQRPDRGILFILFLLIFLLSAPLVVLYTAGYRYHFATGKIVQTGVISLTSYPRNATVSIDGIVMNKRTPAVIDNVLPGEHRVRLEREGFFPWERTLTVRSRETSFVTDAGLFLTSTPSPLTEADILFFSASPDGTDLAYMARTEEWDELRAFHTEDGEELLLARFPAESTAFDTIAWSADASRIMLSEMNGVNSLVMNIVSGQSLSLDGLIADIERTWWDSEKGDVLFIETNENLFSLHVPSERITLIPSGAIAARTLGNEFILAEAIDGRVVISETIGDHAKILAYLPLGNYAFRHTPSDDLVMLEDTLRERIILIDTHSNDQPILLNQIATLWKWELDGERLLYSDGFDLHIYDAPRHTDETLTRLSHGITGISWHPRANTVLFSQRDHISGLDIERTDDAILTELVRGEGFLNLSMDARGKTLYFIGEIDSKPGIYTYELQP